MPIYEYRCGDCGAASSLLLLKPSEMETIHCTLCQSRNMTRVLSRCSFHKTEGQRLQAFDTKAPQSDHFYSDRRNVGLWAKKRMGELGVDLGHHMDQVVEQAREGKIY